MISQQAVSALIQLIATGQKNTALTVRTALEAILLNCNAIPFEVKELDCPISFLNNNFDTTGLGINDMVGWAICNGNNNTQQRGGLVSIGYDKINHALGTTGGNRDTVVVGHTHGITLGQLNGENAQSISEARFSNSGNGSLSQNVTATTTSTGVSGAGMNMQPFMVTLMVQNITV